MTLSLDDTLVQALRELASSATSEPFGLVVEAESLDRLATGLCSTNFSVAVIGDHGSGKSALLDMLLDVKRPRLLVTQILRSGTTPSLQRLNGSTSIALTPNELKRLTEDPGNDSPIEWVFTDKWLGLNMQIIDFAEADGLVPSGQAEHLAQANAFILVVHATRVFSQKEKALLAALLGERDTRQALIVVNNIDKLDADDVDEVQDWVRATLKPYFLNQDGHFDATAFARRVFYVNMQEPSSIAALRDRLYDLCQNNDERSEAASAAALQSALLPTMAMLQHLEKENAKLAVPQQELEALRQSVNRNQSELRQQQLELQRASTDIGDQITHKVYTSLVAMLNTIHDRWEQDASRLMQWEELGMQPLFNALISPEHRSTLHLALIRRTEEYLREQIALWSDDLPELIAPETAKLATLLQQGVNVQLETLGNKLASIRYQSLDEHRLQSTLNTMMRRLLLGGDAIEQIVQRTLMRGLLACLMILTGSIMLKISGIAALIAAEASGSSRQMVSLRHDMLMQMRDQLLAGLREELATSQFGKISFARIDAFMQLLGSDTSQLASYLRNELLLDVKASLTNPSHSDIEQSTFLQQLNAVLERDTPLPVDRLLASELSPETSYTLNHSNDIAQLNRLLLSEAFPEYIRPKVRDLLNASVAFQIGRIVEQAKELLHEQERSVEADPRLSSAQATATTAAQRQVELAALSQHVRDLLTTASISVYGRDFSDDELQVIVARKQAALDPHSRFV